MHVQRPRRRFLPRLPASLPAARAASVAALCVAWGQAMGSATISERLNTGLQACQAALRGALRHDDPVPSDAQLALCDPHRDALLATSAEPGFALSSTQKKEILALADRQLRLVRELSERARKGSEEHIAPVPYLARLTATENALRVLSDRLAALETWSFGTGLRLGAVRYLDGSFEPLGGASALLLLDHGSRLDAGFEIASSTPLREEGGVVELPPREIDAIALTQAWVEFKRFRNFQLKLGVFPDQEGAFTPRRWPFVSLLGRATLVRVAGFETLLSVRHDVFGLFSPRQESSRAGIYERDLSELVGAYETAASEIEWQGRAGWRLHWYTDADGGLPTLSVGRRRYLSASPAPGGTRYRVSDRFAWVRVGFPQSGLAAKVEAEGWNNVLAGGREARGSIVSVEGSLRRGRFESALGATRAEVGCASLPPVALRPTLLPGTMGRILEAQVAFTASRSLQLFARAFRNAARPLGRPANCGNVTRAELAGDVPDFEALFGFLYRVPDDASGLQ